LDASNRWSTYISGRSYIKKNGKTFYLENRKESIFSLIHQDFATNVLRELGIEEENEMVILDVGANSGQFAHGVKQLSSKHTIVSFEPNPEPRLLLELNAKQWSNWYVLPFGISDKLCNLELFYVRGKSGQGSIYEKNATLDLVGGNKEKISKILVKLLGPDEVFAKLKSYPKFDLVKVDVEGFEPEVLAGLARINYDYLLIETSNSRSGGITLEQVTQILNGQKKNTQLIKIFGSPQAAIQDVLFRVEQK
jgi:FkbM family methyltransferase